MNKYIGLLAFVALAWWWTSAEALTPTSRFGIRYAPADTLRVSGTARVDSLDSLLVGGRAVGTMVWQDTTEVFVRRIVVGPPDPPNTRSLEVSLTCSLQADITRSFRTLKLLNSIYIDSNVTNSGLFYGIAFDFLRNKPADKGTLNWMHALNTAFGHYSTVGDSAVTTQAYGISLRPYYQKGRITTLTALNIATPATGGTATTQWAIKSAWDAPSHLLGDLYLGDNIDSASTFQLVVQSGTSFSRLDAGEETFEITSDEALKTNFEAVNTAAIRAATLALPPPRQWQYRTEALRHEPHLALIRADSSRAAVEREVDERLAQEEQDGRTLDRAIVAAEIRTARTAAVVEQAAAYLQQVERRAAIKHTGWTAQELYPLAQVIRPESASPTSTRLTDRVIGLVVTTQAQQGEIDDLKAAVYDPELGGVPLVTYVLGLAALVAALSGYVATLKKQVNNLEARIAALEGVAPNPPNSEEESKT